MGILGQHLERAGLGTGVERREFQMERNNTGIPQAQRSAVRCEHTCHRHHH